MAERQLHGSPVGGTCQAASRWNWTGSAGGRRRRRPLVDYERRTKTGFVVDAIAVNSARADGCRASPGRCPRRGNVGHADSRGDEGAVQDCLSSSAGATGVAPDCRVAPRPPTTAYHVHAVELPTHVREFRRQCVGPVREYAADLGSSTCSDTRGRTDSSPSRRRRYGNECLAPAGRDFRFRGRYSTLSHRSRLRNRSSLSIPWTPMLSATWRRPGARGGSVVGFARLPSDGVSCPAVAAAGPGHCRGVLLTYGHSCRPACRRGAPAGRPYPAV